jgi:hypothetical protein
MDKFLLFVASLLIASTLAHAADTASANSPTPVLIELFTSEGCSSCPPADKLLEELDSKQPIAGAQLIVLSEHVTYWNSDGWKDPFSSQDITDRQSAYGKQFKLASVYTPQMVVDGESQFTGSDSQALQESVQKARAEQKIPVKIAATIDTSGKLKAHVEATGGSGAVYLVLALNHAESQVLRGENGGHRLSHVAVVQSFEQIGSLKKGKEFSKDIEIKIPHGADPANLRVVAFVQQADGMYNPGKVIGAALSMPSK